MHFVSSCFENVEEHKNKAADSKRLSLFKAYKHKRWLRSKNVLIESQPNEHIIQTKLQFIWFERSKIII